MPHLPREENTLRNGNRPLAPPFANRKFMFSPERDRTYSWAKLPWTPNLWPQRFLPTRGYLGFGRLAGFFSGAGKGTCWVASRIWHSLVPKPSLFSRTQSTNDQIYAHHTQYMCIIWPFVIVYPDRMSIGLKYHQSHRPLCILVYSLLCTYSALYVYLCTINYCVLLSESWLCVHPNFLVLELRLASVMIPVYMYVSLLSPLTLVGGANLLRMI